MQTIKNKMHDLNAMRKAKSDARAEEKAEKEMAQTRVEVAHEVRKAREAEAAMEMHVSKAQELAHKEMEKHQPKSDGSHQSASSFKKLQEN